MDSLRRQLPLGGIREHLQERKQLVHASYGVEIQEIAAIQLLLQLAEVLRFRDEDERQPGCDHQRCPGKPEQTLPISPARAFFYSGPLMKNLGFPASRYCHRRSLELVRRGLAGGCFK